jgi:DNA-binding transcriptional LysR family regulator
VEARQLEILRELGALGSVRAVAEALHITSSAVSQQLKLLQQPIPVPLTRREGRTLGLTEAGQRLAAAGADVATATARAREVSRALASTRHDTVRVAAFNSAALAFFPALTKSFPDGGDLRVELADEDVAQRGFAPLTSSYDVVVAHRFRHTAAWPDATAVTPLLVEPLDVALPAGHALARHRSITAARAAAQPWITTHRGFPVGAIIDALAAVTGRPVRVVHRVNEFSVAAELVRAGAGLALIPRWTTAAPPGVVLRPLVGVRSARHVDALTRPENMTRPAVREVIAELRRTADKLSAAR